MNTSILLGASNDKDHYVSAGPTDTIDQLRFMKAEPHLDTSGYVNSTLISYTISTWDTTNNESVNVGSELDLIGSGRFSQSKDNWILNVSLYFGSAHAFVRIVDDHDFFDTTRSYWWHRRLIKLDNSFAILRYHRGIKENYYGCIHTALLLIDWIVNSLLVLKTTSNIVIAIHYGSEVSKFVHRVVEESYPFTASLNAILFTAPVAAFYTLT